LGASDGDGFHLFFATSFCAPSFPGLSAFFRVLFDNKPPTALGVSADLLSTPTTA
jgi:hypothetical protein